MRPRHRRHAHPRSFMWVLSSPVATRTPGMQRVGDKHDRCTVGDNIMCPNKLSRCRDVLPRVSSLVIDQNLLGGHTELTSNRRHHRPLRDRVRDRSPGNNQHRMVVTSPLCHALLDPPSQYVRCAAIRIGSPTEHDNHSCHCCGVRRLGQAATASFRSNQECPSMRAAAIMPRIDKM